MAPTDYQAQLEAFVVDQALTGATFAYWDGDETHLAMAGLRNSVTADPVTNDTIFHIGSISKVFTTVLVMQLVSDGKIYLDDPITCHLPGLRLRDETALGKITCKMLLNHTSGIDGDMLADHGPDRERIVDALERCADMGQVHPPGERASYCNIGTVIAGHLVQTLRETSWYNEIRDRIFAPLGMEYSIADPTQLSRYRHAIGDVTDGLRRKHQTTKPFLPLSFAPAGSTVMMSGADLITFGRTLVNQGRAPNGFCLLSPDLCRAMQQPTASLIQPSIRIGLGWMMMPGGVLTHGGTVSGGAARLYAHAESGRVATIMTNCDNKRAPALFLNQICTRWSGGSLVEQFEQSVQYVRDTAAIVGRYESRLQRIDVRHTENGLCVEYSWSVPVLDNTPSREAPAIANMRKSGPRSFEILDLTPGTASTPVSFLGSVAGGNACYLAMDGRLLPRVGA